MKKVIRLIILLLSFTKINAVVLYTQLQDLALPCSYRMIQNIEDVKELDSIVKWEKFEYSILTFYDISSDSIDILLNNIKNKNRVIGFEFNRLISKEPPKELFSFPHRYLSFIECDSLEKLFIYNGFHQIELSFIDCNLKHLPDSIEYIDAYFDLTLKFKNGFQDIDINKELNRFKKKNLFSLSITIDTMQSFPEAIFNFPMLNRLSLNSLSEFENIPDSFDLLPNLFYVTINRNKKLGIPKSLQELKKQEMALCI